MKRVVNAVVSIEYEDNGTFPLNDNNLRDEAAMGLTIIPNFHTVESGISVKKVEADIINADMLIDWDKLRHNPDYVWLNVKL